MKENTEYIEKGPLMKFIEDGLNNTDPKKAFGHDAIEIMTEMQFTPAAPVREVVTCGECIFHNPQGCAKGAGFCEEPSMRKFTADNFFCGYGKRADTGQTEREVAGGATPESE